MKFKKLLMNIERFLPMFLMMIFIFMESSKRAVMVSYNPGLDFSVHKIAHFVLFSLLYLTAVRAFKNLKLALLFTILYAISDELHQFFTPTRNPSIRDIIIDSVSAGLVFYYLKKYQKKLPHVLKNFLDL